MKSPCFAPRFLVAVPSVSPLISSSPEDRSRKSSSGLFASR
jgi:hypothetical protein